MAENEAMSAPMANPLALKIFAKIGSSGSTMPKPIRSMKTVRKIMNTDGFFMVFVRIRRSRQRPQPNGKFGNGPRQLFHPQGQPYPQDDTAATIGARGSRLPSPRA